MIETNVAELICPGHQCVCQFRQHALPDNIFVTVVDYN